MLLKPRFGVRTTVIVAAYLLLVVSVFALARSGAAGRGAIARYGLVVAGAGWVLAVVAELALRVDVDLAEQVIFPIAIIAIGIGMVAAGVGVLRTGRWHGWRRWMPLACGAYPFAVTFPVFAAAGEPTSWSCRAGVSAGWSSPSLSGVPRMNDVAADDSCFGHPWFPRSRGRTRTAPASVDYLVCLGW